MKTKPKHRGFYVRLTSSEFMKLQNELKKLDISKTTWIRRKIADIKDKK